MNSSELTHKIRIDALPLEGERMELVPTAAQRVALARRFDLRDLSQMAVKMQLTPRPGEQDGVRVEGTLRVNCVQTCCVTLQPIAQELEESFIEEFGGCPSDVLDGVEVEVAADMEPDILYNGQLDVGELAAQQLGLALPAWPRLPGADLEAVWRESGATDQTFSVNQPENNPFAALASLKQGKKL